MPYLRCLLSAALAVVFALAALRAQTPPAPVTCPLCTDATIVCPTCNGEGTRPVDCWLCGADGTVECPRCPKQPGVVDCPNPVCHDGQAVWTLGDTDPCKLCKAKGTVRCPECGGKKGWRCTVCNGTGKRIATCPTCVGGKRIACPLCSPPGAEPGCCACGLATCRLCPKDDKGTHACIRCNGTGGVVCPQCDGLDRVPCKLCGATGKVRMATKRNVGSIPDPGVKAGVKQCERCNGTGIWNCFRCKGGRQDCPACEAGRAARSCAACLFRGVVPCDDCLSGGYAKPEFLALHLIEKGFPRQAVPLLERAIATAARMNGPRVPIVGLPAEVKADDLQLAREQFLRALGMLPAPSPPPADIRAADENLEVRLPAAARLRYWPDPPQDHPLEPWQSPSWLKSHRERTVQRLQAALERAREAAAAVPK